ncbi:MAG: peptidase S58 family protein [Gemmatimonadales bacterium]|nr:peptidase S58 family protein [Gemmatimonadales bacterium]NIN10767.1 peptidase S58 family protein [Gemmatimonadales bacterium]NIQ98997.1 peptidase S58 family protein [Gemmatimonadales bacterium]NIS63816.1 peptidase S58 family protein [Gemmatimonadales bacterium]
MPSRAPSLTSVEGLQVGHATDREAATGCTVVLAPPEGMAAAAAVRGRATGTRELDALSPHHLVPRIHAILLTGGSAFGLGAADGVMRWLAERGRGFNVGVGVVPIVPTAVVFDLALLGRSDRWPGPEDGYGACEAASTDLAEGSLGAGTGATVGKVLGAAGAMKSGLGTWAEHRGDLVVGALAVVNAFGDVRDASGRIIAGARHDGEFVDTRAFLAEGKAPVGSFGRTGGNTTLVVVGTNAQLERVQLSEMAATSVDALAQRITPLGTRVDGDIVFAVSTGKQPEANPTTVELMAQSVAATAIERAVRLATGTREIPGLADELAAT